jgi:hypothetical protein
VLHTSQAGKIGCLVRLEPNTNNGVSFFLPISFERCNTKKKNADADF